MSETENKQAAPPVEATAKKPYAAPKLRHLGSVRNLTLGSTGDCQTDAQFTFKHDGC